MQDKLNQRGRREVGGDTNNNNATDNNNKHEDATEKNKIKIKTKLWK